MTASRAERPRLRAVPQVRPRVRVTQFGGGSHRSEMLVGALRRTIRPFLSVWAKAPLLPWPYFLVDYAGLLLRTVPGTTHEELRLPECRAEITRTPATEDRVVLYLHGGAFLVGGRFLHRQLISRISEATRAEMVAVEYRQLPAHPVSASISDGLDAYRHLLDSGVDPEKIVIMGDSAGGYLTFQIALEAEREGLPMPAGLVALAPLIDFDGTAKVAAPSAATCALFAPECFDSLAEVVLRASRRAGEPHALPDAPSRALLHGLPRSLIQVSSSEAIFPDAESMARALTDAGVECELQVWDGQVHVFQAGASLLPEAVEAIEEIARFVDEVVPDRPRVLGA